MMCLTSFTFYGDPKYLNFSDEILKYNNPEKDIWLPDPSALQSKAILEKKEYKKILQEMKKEDDKKPVYILEEEREKMIKLEKEAYDSIFEYCKFHKFFLSDVEHIRSKRGVPVFNEKYKIELSPEGWSFLMAQVWNEIEKTDEYSKEYFFCGQKFPKSYTRGDFSHI